MLERERERERERESLCFKTRIIWMCENKEGEGREGWKREREEGYWREIEWGGEERVGGGVRVGEWVVRERERVSGEREMGESERERESPIFV